MTRVLGCKALSSKHMSQMAIAVHAHNFDAACPILFELLLHRSFDFIVKARPATAAMKLGGASYSGALQRRQMYVPTSSRSVYSPRNGAPCLYAK